MPYQVYFQHLAFQETDPKNPTVPVGEPVVLDRGDLLPSWVPTFQISALESAGMIVSVAEPDPRIFPADTLPPQVRTPEMPPVLPSDPNGVPPLLGDLATSEPAEPVVEGDPAPVVVDVVPADRPPAGPPPRASDKKEVWEAYATTVGISLADAESLNKTELIAAVHERTGN